MFLQMKNDKSMNQHFSAISWRETSYFSMRWWWGLLVQSENRHVAPLKTHFPDKTSSVSSVLFSRETANTNFIVFGFIGLKLRSTVLEVRMLTITPTMWLKMTMTTHPIYSKYFNKICDHIIKYLSLTASYLKHISCGS